jgi:hypothetical protein
MYKKRRNKNTRYNTYTYTVHYTYTLMAGDTCDTCDARGSLTLDYKRQQTQTVCKRISNKTTQPSAPRGGASSGPQGQGRRLAGS